MGDEMGLKVVKVEDGIGIFFPKWEHVQGTGYNMTVEVTNEIGKLLMGKLAAYYHPDFKDAHVINLAQALRTLTNIVAEMHSHDWKPECMICHALEESDAAGALQDYDNAWKVDA